MIVAAKRKDWTDAEVELLLKLTEAETPDAAIAELLGRNVATIQEKRRRVRDAKTLRQVIRDPSIQSEASREQRVGPFNRAAHRIYRESGGEYGWPEHEWRPLPKRGEVWNPDE